MVQSSYKLHIQLVCVVVYMQLMQPSVEKYVNTLLFIHCHTWPTSEFQQRNLGVKSFQMFASDKILNPVSVFVFKARYLLCPISSKEFDMTTNWRRTIFSSAFVMMKKQVTSLNNIEVKEYRIYNTYVTHC